MALNNTYIVYKHTSPSNKVYIGITKNSVNRRWENGHGYKHSPHFNSAIQKYGWDNIKHEILFTGLTKEQAIKKEIELIAFYKSNEREYGYNVTSGGDGTRDTKISEAHKLSISKANKNKIVSLETRQKISEAHTGKKLSDNTKQKIREYHINLKQSQETIEKRASANRKKVVQFTLDGQLVAQYLSVKEAGELTHIDNTCISACLRNRQKMAGGYIWRYAI